MINIMHFAIQYLALSFQIRVNPHDYSSIQDIADEITNIQSLRNESLVEYHGVEIHKVSMDIVLLILIIW